MPIQNPSAAIQFPGFLSPTASLQTWEGLLHPTYLKGGFQSVTTLAERNALPIWQEGNALEHLGFSESGDGGYTSGRRSIGMLVYVLENNKFYTLCPKGYFVNPVDANTPALGETEWQALDQWVKAGLLKPNSTSIYDNTNSGPPTFTPNQYTPTSTDANDPWVELSFGDNVYTSNLAGTIAMVDDVGGMPAGTLVSDLTDIKTYDELFDTILFPTSYPTATQPQASLSCGIILREIGEVIDVPLTTGATLGQITLDGTNQGPYAGNVTAAEITGPGGPYTLSVGPGATDIDDMTVSSHTVVEGSIPGNRWVITTTFAAGPMPLDSTGADYASLQYTGGTDTHQTSFEGVYPIFLGNAAGGFDQRALISHAANNIQCDQNYDENLATSLYHRISIPNDMIDGRTIQVFQLNTVSGNYDEATSGWVQTADADRTIQGNAVQYTLLTSSVAVTGANQYRIRFV